MTALVKVRNPETGELISRRDQLPTVGICLECEGPIRSGDTCAIFPEGAVHSSPCYAANPRDPDGFPIEDGRWKP